ncbi:MAG: RagB/SusD family nutrient uptake outer membrane protein [Saprospiraceae bacterium]|nr:RagB/SusD family nutrient uptake outer membrane protein [Saprospiraceae bacterium]
MQRYIKACMLVGMLSLFSCGEDFLEIEPQQSLSISSAITDLNSLNAAVLGVYNNLVSDENTYRWDLLLVPDLRSDNVYISSKNAGRFLAFDEYRLIAQSGRPAGQWVEGYQTIVNASNVINNVASATILSSEEAEAENRVGEMYAVRALSYWNLVRNYARPYSADGGASAGVPFNNAGTNGEIITPARETVAAVYQQIISDLEAAIGLMTLEQNGRFSKAGAQALLAKVYIYMEEWTLAEQLATEVINSGRYALYTDANAWLNSWGANIGDEDIFTLINTPTDNGGVNSIGGIYDQDGYGDVLATEDLFNIYAATDIRRSVMNRGDRLDGEKDALFPEGKYPNGETGQDYYKIIRLADIYLIRAEARAELGNDAGARADLDAIAGRVDEGYVLSSASGQDLIDAIILERRKEFAFEGDRIYDLTRRQLSWTKYRTFEAFTVNWDNDQVYNPIPQIELDVNPNMIQNSGY